MTVAGVPGARNAGAAVPPAAELVVREVVARAVVVPLRRPLTTRIGEFARWPLVLIDVHTEQGITGRAYLAALDGMEIGEAEILADDLSRAVRTQLHRPLAERLTLPL